MSDLDMLEREAQAIDAELASEQFSQQETAPQPSINDNFKPAIMQFLGFAVGLVNAKIPFTGQHFTRETQETIADSIIKVADVEGVDLNALLGDPNSRFGAWIALAIAVGLPSFTLYLAVVEYNKTKEKPPTEKEVKSTDFEPQPQTTGFHA